MAVPPLILSLALLLAAPAFGQESRPLPTQGDQSTDNEMAATDGDGLALSMLIAINDHVLASAEIARRKNLSQPIADYAKFLFDEHTAHRKRNEEILRSIGAERAEPAELKSMLAANEAAREALEDLDGDAFETAFVEAMLKDHAGATALIDVRLRPAASNDDVVTHLRTTHAHFSTHRERARMLAASPES